MGDNIQELKDSEKYDDGDLAVNVDETGKESGGLNMAWIPGLIFIGVGTVLLLNNLTGFELDNWWALFILIPALGSLGNFAREYRVNGRMNKEARGSLIGGLILLLVTATFLFGWSWGVIWPFFLIIAGLGALLSGIFD